MAADKALGPALPSMQATAVINDTFTEDAMIAWFRGEFAATNAIIDALCGHLAHLGGGGGRSRGVYEGVFPVIHRRRINWIPVLQMQKYHSIVDVVVELGRVAAAASAPAKEAEPTGAAPGGEKECFDDGKGKEEKESVAKANDKAGSAKGEIVGTAAKVEEEEEEEAVATIHPPKTLTRMERDSVKVKFLLFGLGSIYATIQLHRTCHVIELATSSYNRVLSFMSKR